MYRILNSDLDIRMEDTSPGAQQGRRLESGPRRQLVETASKSDPRLKDLFELDYELGESKDKPDDPSDIRPYINLDRQYVARWSPLDLKLISQYIEIEAFDEELLETETPGVVFDMPPNAYAVITMDLRHIEPESPVWTYGEDWSISIMMEPEISIGDLSKPIPMPE